MPDGTLAPENVAAFLDSIRRYRLLTAAQLETLATDSQHADLRALARNLVQRGMLTHYQVNLLFQGRGAELLLEPYVILARLGEGGSGLVLKGRHLFMQRIVAIKLIRKDLLADPDVVARFNREIEVASQVSHANVVHAYDAGPLGGTFGLVMEYVEGTDLARLIKDEGPLSCERACAYIRQTALGLQHVHEQGLIHRDIKPSNLLLAVPKENEGGTGTVKILDLGLARLNSRKAAQAQASQLTTVGSLMMGTPDYMAPEQAIDLRSTDIRADIYSLGCTLHYLLTGDPPFPAGSLAQKLMKHQQAEPPSLTKRRPELPAVLDAIFRKMMTKDPADRYQTPAEVAEALAPLASVSSSGSSSTWNVAVTAKRPATTPVTKLPAAAKRPTRQSSLPPVRAPRRRRWQLLAGAGTAALLLAIFLTVLLWPSSSATLKSQPQAERSSREPFPDRILTVLGEQRGRSSSNISNLSFSLDGRRLATSNSDNSIRLWDAAAMTEQLTVPLPAGRTPASILAWAPDGQRFACLVHTGDDDDGQNSHEMKVFDGSSGKEERSWPWPCNACWALGFSADGSTLTGIAQKRGMAIGEMRCWDVAANKEKRPPQDVGPCSRAMISANGAHAVTSNGNEWKYWNVAQGTMLVSGNLPYLLAPLINADGNLLYAVVRRAADPSRYDVHVIEFPQPNQSKTRAVLAIDDTPFQMYPPFLGGTSPLLGAWGIPTDGARRTSELRIWDLSKSPIKRLSGPGPSVRTGASVFTPDGKNLVVAIGQGNLIVWDTATWTERNPDPGHRGLVAALGFNDADQSLLSACVYDRSLRAWDLPSGKVKASHSFVQDTSNSPSGGGASIGDGRSIVYMTDKVVKCWDPLAGRARDLTAAENTEAIRFALASPDGRSALVVQSRTIKLCDLAGGKEQFVLRDVTSVSAPTALCWSGDGKSVAVAGHMAGKPGKPSIWTVRVINAANGTERLRVPDNFFIGVGSLSLSHDGKSLAVAGQRKVGAPFDLALWDVDSASERPGAARQITGTPHVLFAPSGDTFAYWDYQNLYLCDGSPSKLRHTLPVPGQYRFAAFSRDGKRLAYISHDGQLTLLDCAAGTKLRSWKFPGTPYALSISGDGKLVAVGSLNGLIHVYNAAASE